MTLQPCFSSTNQNLSKPQEWSFSKSYFVDIVLIFSEVNSLCLWNSILWRRYKWIKIVLKHFHKEREWCHSSLRYFATEYNYIIRISHRRFSVREGVLWGKVFLQNLQENTCVRVSFLIKLQADIGVFLWILQNV